jgi:hypothetical protein
MKGSPQACSAGVELVFGRPVGRSSALKLTCAAGRPLRASGTLGARKAAYRCDSMTALTGYFAPPPAYDGARARITDLFALAR